ncbi:OmpH family outer membrane protein [Alistipes sp. OttesenSCG-928-L06]|nr:OmpH family outer membrane protein [Alistipes sp. OttesenSCG-928-L06]
MKNGMKWMLVAILAIVGSTAMAQQVKLGYVNSQELFAALPERDSAIVKLQTYALELQDQLELSQVEFNKKLNELQKDFQTMNEGVKAMKQKELEDMRDRLQQQQEVAQEELGKMEQALMLPIYEKINQAIQKVSKDNGITAVFDSSSMLYYNENGMVNLLPLAKKELGIQ